MTASLLRRALRWTHIVTAIVLGTFLYSPLAADPAFAAVTKFVAFPAMALTGLAMWQQGRIGRLMKRA
jgi:hypothetical protein